MENSDIQAEDLESVEEEPQSDIAPRAISEENNYVDFAHLKRYHESLKSTTPPCTYYLIGGKAPADTGAVESSYTLAIADLYPTKPIPVADNIVIFTTTAASYIGQVTDVQEATVTVTVRQKFLAGQVTS